ncbi:hypothetical protein Gotri_026359 [Gossypium trilobum]|uniref:DUF4283 domain-containing protein n=1 Tax=Gossypium trilobum TaxID=34281 RepID=A0A7J9FR39_9ROSI|nr:hypothetical protein [Gossypium trilobum]
MVPLILTMGMELQEFEDGYIRISNLNGILSIDFSNRITKILIKGMELTVVVKILEEIGSLAEGVIKLDIKTDNRERGQFTRMADFVDLEKLLTFRVLVNGQLQCVEFEALPEVCLSCGKYRHLKNMSFFFDSSEWSRW